MTVTAEVQNSERLLRKLTRIPEAMREKIRTAMAAEADEIVEFARRLVPKDSGALAASIGWRWGARAPNGSISIGTVEVPSGPNGTVLTLTIYAGNDRAYYARFVEFGTSKMAKRPFFFPAYRARRREARNAIRRAVRAAAKQVAANG